MPTHNSLAIAFMIFKNINLLNSKYTLTLHLALIKQDDLAMLSAL